MIVLGILLAFRIDAWWEGRQERRQALELERTGLELMLADLVADTVEIDSVVFSAGLHDRAAAEVLHAVGGGELMTLSPGEMFYENPDDIHAVSANASESEPARILVHLIKTVGAPVTTPAGR